jgi:hypothetical protein
MYFIAIIRNYKKCIAFQIIIVCILFNGLIMMGITREDDFVSRAAGEWRNSSTNRIILYFLYDYEEKLINKLHY